jgi:hypothetical protein
LIDWLDWLNHHESPFYLISFHTFDVLCLQFVNNFHHAVMVEHDGKSVELSTSNRSALLMLPSPPHPPLVLRRTETILSLLATGTG